MTAPKNIDPGFEALKTKALAMYGAMPYAPLAHLSAKTIGSAKDSHDLAVFFVTLVEKLTPVLREIGQADTIRHAELLELQRDVEGMRRLFGTV